jgi:hypothetical protein
MLNTNSLIVASNLSCDVHPENTASKFINIFPTPIISNAKVCLQSICFDNNFSNVPKAVIDSPPHFLISDVGDNKITLENNLYTPRTLLHFLEGKTTSTKVNYKIKNDRLLIYLKKNCTMMISENVCNWLTINTMANRKTGGYVEFKADNLPILLTCQQPNFEGDKPPQFIKIRVNELTSSLDGVGYHRDLSIIPYKTAGPTFFQEIARGEYFNTETELPGLTITLLDENNNQLNLLRGQPSILKLKFAQMNTPSFLLRLSSSDSSNLFNDNTQSSFRIQLPHSIDLEKEKWEAALSSIYYPAQIDISKFLTPKDFWIELLYVKNGVDIKKKIDLSGENVSTLGQLQIVLNKKIAETVGEQILIIAFGGTTGCLSYASTKTLTMRMSPLFAKVIGDFNLKTSDTHMDISLTNAERGQFVGSANLKKCLPNTIILVADMIKCTIFGDRYVNLLKLIPVLGESNGEYMSYEPSNLDFIDVIPQHLSSFSFALLDLSSDQHIPFIDNSCKTMINILFRKKK